MAETLPENWRQTYREDSGAFVIETPDATLRWAQQDWADLTYQPKGSPAALPVPLQEDGPAPDALIRFETGVDLCGMSMGVAAFVYAPDDLREQASYVWLRVLFDVNEPEKNWQVWDTAAEALNFGYDGRDIQNYYDVDCQTMLFTYTGPDPAQN